MGTSCDYLCTGLTDLLQIRGYSREKAGLSLPYKVYGAESAFLILISDLFEPVRPPLSSEYTYHNNRQAFRLAVACLDPFGGN